MELNLKEAIKDYNNICEVLKTVIELNHNFINPQTFIHLLKMLKGKVDEHNNGVIPLSANDDGATAFLTMRHDLYEGTIDLKPILTIKTKDNEELFSIDLKDGILLLK